MDVGGGRGRGVISSMDASPGRARLSYSRHQQEQQRLMMRPPRKVQVIYYLSRHGQLEHPHFIELPYLPNQQFRLRDVMERLIVLRGKGMPSLFSWSCKRSYKNAYVWNDLAENDVIYPADGVEYVLKGSEIIPGAYERFQRIPGSSRQPKPLPISRKLHLELEDDEEEEGDEEEEVVAEEEGMEEEEPRRGNRTADCRGAGYARRSRGVSKDEVERVENHHAPTELPLDDDSSPPSSTSSDKPHGPGGGSSRRFEDADQAPEPGQQARSSVLLQLIACGSAALKRRSGPGGGTAKGGAAASASGGGKRGSGLDAGVASRREVEVDELRGVSENSGRFRHPLVEDKEYFSGSIRGADQGLRPRLSLPSRNPPPTTKKGVQSMGLREGGWRLRKEEQGV